MLKLLNEVDIYIERENLNEVVEKILEFNVFEDIYVSEMECIFENIKYGRISIFVERERKESLYKYFSEEYNGKAVIIG